MRIVGGPPEHGLRISVERAPRGGPPWAYEGAVETKSGEVRVQAVIDDAGVVNVSGDALTAELAEKIRLLLRAIYKQSHADGTPPARKIVRWRGEK